METHTMQLHRSCTASPGVGAGDRTRLSHLRAASRNHWVRLPSLFLHHMVFIFIFCISRHRSKVKMLTLPSLSFLPHISLNVGSHIPILLDPLTPPLPLSSRSSPARSPTTAAAVSSTVMSSQTTSSSVDMYREKVDVQSVEWSRT